MLKVRSYDIGSSRTKDELTGTYLIVYDHWGNPAAVIEEPMPGAVTVVTPHDGDEFAKKLLQVQIADNTIVTHLKQAPVPAGYQPRNLLGK